MTQCADEGAGGGGGVPCPKTRPLDTPANKSARVDNNSLTSYPSSQQTMMTGHDQAHSRFSSA